MPESEEVDTALWAGIQDGRHLPFQHLARATAPTEQFYKNEPTDYCKNKKGRWVWSQFRIKSISNHQTCSARDWERSGLLEENPQNW
jgi:hypothetical protein